MMQLLSWLADNGFQRPKIADTLSGWMVVIFPQPAASAQSLIKPAHADILISLTTADAPDDKFAAQFIEAYRQCTDILIT